MAHTHLPYELSQQADGDLEEIFDYTVRNFGYNQAVTYVGNFEALFNRLADNPLLGPERSEIRPGLRSFVAESHTVFYHFLKGTLRIVRVLHVSRDIGKWMGSTD